LDDTLARAARSAGAGRLMDSAATQQPSLRLYLVAQTTYFAAGGLSGVLIPWLLAHELHASEAVVGAAQALSALPTMLFVLFGGAIDARGLLLSGILIGALGALDDVTMTQSSAVFELHDANPSLQPRGLYERGMRIGRDHIASIVNTLVLAYAGASMPLLVILASQTEGLGTLLNREFLASEIVRTVFGSIGIVAAVPLTTAIAAVLAKPGGATVAPAARAGSRRIRS